MSSWCGRSAKKYMRNDNRLFETSYVTDQGNYFVWVIYISWRVSLRGELDTLSFMHIFRAVDSPRDRDLLLTWWLMVRIPTLLIPLTPRYRCGQFSYQNPSCITWLKVMSTKPIRPQSGNSRILSENIFREGSQHDIFAIPSLPSAHIKGTKRRSYQYQFCPSKRGSIIIIESSWPIAVWSPPTTHTRPHDRQPSAGHITTSIQTLP